MEALDIKADGMRSFSLPPGHQKNDIIKGIDQVSSLNSKAADEMFYFSLPSHIYLSDAEESCGKEQ